MLLLLVELALRSVEPALLIAHERGPNRRYAARERIRAYGPADVVFFGSSRVQSAVLPPYIRQRLADDLDQTLRVESYAAGGATVVEIRWFVRWLLLQNRRPRLVVLEAYTPDLYGAELVNDRAAIFWSLRDWVQSRREHGALVDPWFPVALRNHLADGSALFRYRERPLNLLKTFARLRRFTQLSPVKGEIDQMDHVEWADRHMTSFDQEYLAKHCEEGHLVEGVVAWNPLRVDILRETLAALRVAGVPTILVEYPPTRYFNSGYPSGTPSEARRRFRALAEETGVPFVSSKGLEELLDDSLHYRDANHLNLAGAKIVSRWLVEAAVEPMLDGTLGPP